MGFVYVHFPRITEDPQGQELNLTILYIFYPISGYMLLSSGNLPVVQGKCWYTEGCYFSTSTRLIISFVKLCNCLTSCPSHPLENIPHPVWHVEEAHF